MLAFLLLYLKQNRLTPTEQQPDYQAETGRDRHGLPRMTTYVGFSGFDRRFGPVTNAGDRVPSLLKFQGDLPTKGVRFLTHQ